MKLAAFFLIALSVLAPAAIEWDELQKTISVDPADKKVATQFGFTNTGDREVKIKSVKSSCGCTAASVGAGVIAPGEKGVVSIEFTIGDRRGFYEAPIKVRTDDPSSLETKLSFRVMIREPVEIAPKVLFWRKGEAPTSKSASIRAADGEEISTVNLTSKIPSASAQVETVTAGREYRLVVSPGQDAGVSKGECNVDVLLASGRTISSRIFVKLR